MTERRLLSRLAGLLLTTVVAITVITCGFGETYAQAASNSSSTKVDFRVVAAPATTTLPTTTTTTLPTTTTTAPPSISSAHTSSAGGLPITGGPFQQLVLIAAGMAAVGSLLVAVAGRRRT